MASNCSVRDHYLKGNKEPDNTPIDFQLQLLDSNGSWSVGDDGKPLEVSNLKDKVHLLEDLHYDSMQETKHS